MSQNWLSNIVYNTVFLVAVFSATRSSAQYIPVTDIPCAQYGNTLHDPFCGGFTAPQFSEADINLDGSPDLFVFDRGAWLPMVFLRNTVDNSLYYDPAFQAIFPPLEDWALLRDFNHDGISDIFTYSSGTTRVFKGNIIDDALAFSLEKNELLYTDGTGTTALYTSRTDIPAIDDIDGDGDLDVLSFSVSNATIRFYKNESVEEGYGTDSLIFSLDEFCWGELFEEASCDGAVLNVVCKGGPDNIAVSLKTELHIGSTITTFDKDGDGDKDAIIGDNTCNNIVYYRNGGSAAYAQMDLRDSEFPSNTLSFSLPTFPAGYFADIDADGDKDLLATTNDHQLGANLQQVWLYENLHTNDTFDLEFATDTFLVDGFIDAGAYSRPIYFDHNVDGLYDILIGVGGSYGKDEIQRHGMWLYENTGTAAVPAFTLVNTDYAGLNAWPINQLSPAAGDMDNDGDADLLIGVSDGTLCYLENTAGPGNTAAFGPPECIWQGIDVGQIAAPCIIDIDEDERPDLVIGEQNGNLNYWRNTGTLTEPAFTLESEIWGGVDVRKTGFITGYSVPYMYRNENDSLYLAVGSQSGYVFEFNEIEDALLGEFYERDTNMLGWYPGNHASIYGGDINNDGERDWLVGNIRGGVLVMYRDHGIGIPELQEQLPVQAFPNPSDATIVFQWQNGLGPVVIRIFDITGSLLRSQMVSGNIMQVDISEFPPGCYLTEIISGTKNGVVQWIKQ